MLWDFEHMLIKYLWVVDEDLEGKKLPTFDYVPCRYKRNYTTTLVLVITKIRAVRSIF